MINYCPRRKSQSKIKKEQERTSIERTRYRPPMGKGHSTELEKHRLRMRFQFKGGKSLPSAANTTGMKGHIPMHLMMSDEARVRKEAREQQQNPRGEHGHAGTNTLEQKVQDLHGEFDRIMSEIEERRTFLEEAVKRGEEGVWGPQIKGEIARLVRNLESVDKQLKAYSQQ